MVVKNGGNGVIEFGVEFHNVDHLEKVPGMEGWRLERFPKQMKEELGIPGNHNGRFRSKFVQGCEIRFVTDASFFEIGLSAAWRDQEITVYYGDMMHSRHVLPVGACTVLHIDYPEAFQQVDASQIPRGRFAPCVWRIQFGNGGYGYFHYLDTYGKKVRPPKKEEKPSVTWAAYGSSITCGYVSNLYGNSYVEQAAISLGYDVLNKGLSGSCMGEGIMAEYLAFLPVDVLSLELGVNMLSFLEPDTFSNRVSHMIKTLTRNSPAKQIFVIDMFGNRGKILTDHGDRRYRNYQAFRRIVKEQAAQWGDERMVYLDGECILKSLTWLSTDLLHPSDMGHIRMGRELAALMEGGAAKKLEIFEKIS